MASDKITLNSSFLELSDVNITLSAYFKAALSINGLFDLSLLPPQPKTTTKLSKKSCNDDRNKRNPSGLCA